MKIGVITDVHSNIAALDAVLAEFARRGIEGVICLGDIIGIGAFPEETARRVMEIPNLLACVRGNHESYLARGIPKWMHEPEASYHAWEHARLSDESRTFLLSLPADARLTMEGVSVYCTHYPIDGFDYAPIGRERALALFPEADVCLYGHDHSCAIDGEGGRLYVNCGSLGCPGRERDVARAGVLTVADGTAAIEPIVVRYDVAPTIRAIREFAFPAMDDILTIFYGQGTTPRP